MNKISFPGLGIDEFSVNEVAFSIFGRDIAWYALIITTGIILAVAYIFLRLREKGLVFDDLIDVTFFTVIPGMICARLYYVLFYELENPGTYKSFLDVIAIWNGGIAIYGGIIGGALGAFLTLRIKKMRVTQFFDALGPGVMLAQSIGRWGNFFNSEAYGSQTTLPWRMGVIEGGEMIYVHPTFLYESLFNLLGFILINIFYKKKKYDGQIILIYFTWYGFGRMLIEGLRTDSLYIGSSGIRVSQLVAFICFVLGLSALIFFGIKYKKRHVARTIYCKGSKRYVPLEPQTEPAEPENAEPESTPENNAENGENGKNGENGENAENADDTDDGDDTDDADAESGSKDTE